MTTGYDLIGDIHGHASQLEDLLKKLEYKMVDGVYEHPSREVIFVGDLIDRGSENKRTVQIVRAMVENQTAKCVLGNHELNAIAYHTPDGNGGWVRKRSKKNVEQHLAFTGEFNQTNQKELDGCLSFFKKLPLYLDLGELRVIHACWHKSHLDAINPLLDPGQIITESVIERSHTKGEVSFKAIDVLLKGQEVQLPKGISFFDKSGHGREKMRTKWWLNNPRNLGEYSLMPHVLEDKHLAIPAEGSDVVGYPEDAPPLFIGHYWEKGEPKPFAPNVACVDYSMGMGKEKGGNLVAYRWDGEQVLKDSAFVKLFV
jgi:hypothetical protein